MEILNLILVIALIYAVVKIFYLKNDIRNINKNLQVIKNNDTNKRIVSISMDKEIIKLIKEINLILDKDAKNKLEYEKNNRKLKEMITNISHDLRTPLTSIKGYIEYINSKSMSEDDINKYLEVVNDKAIILQELLDSFFQLSRLEERTYPIEINKVNIYKLLTEVLLTFYEDFNLKNIHPIVNVEGNKVQALADEKAVKRVFINMFQNILKHKGKDVEINIYSNEKFIIIDFKNRTDNLTDNDIDNLYDRFFTADKMRSNRNTGLGLTIVKKLVDQMNGEIKTSINDHILCISVRLRY